MRYMSTARATRAARVARAARAAKAAKAARAARATKAARAASKPQIIRSRCRKTTATCERTTGRNTRKCLLAALLLWLVLCASCSVLCFACYYYYLYCVLYSSAFDSHVRNKLLSAFHSKHSTRHVFPACPTHAQSLLSSAMQASPCCWHPLSYRRLFSHVAQHGSLSTTRENIAIW